MRPLLAIALLLLSAPALAQGDPLKSAACGERLDALQAARAQGRDDVEALRRAATQACLGGSGEARRPSPTAQAPVSVLPPRFDVPVIPPPTPAPPQVVTPPKVITHCDAAGCWTHQGTHLNRVGPTVVGPSGAACVPGPAGICP